MQVGRRLGEFLGGLGIDRRDRGGEGNALGRERQAEALRHVAVLARNGNAGKAAPLDLAREIERGAPLPRWGDEIERGQLRGHLAGATASWILRWARCASRPWRSDRDSS